MLCRRNGLPVSSDSARLLRRIWPPPSPKEPSSSMRDSLMLPGEQIPAKSSPGKSSRGVCAGWRFPARNRFLSGRALGVSVTAAPTQRAAPGVLFRAPPPGHLMDELHPGDRVLILDGPFMAREATVEQVDQELRIAHLSLEFIPGHSVTIVEPFDRLRRLDVAP